MLQVEAWDYNPESSSPRGYASLELQIHTTPANDPPSILGPNGNTFLGKEDVKLTLGEKGGMVLADPDETVKTSGLFELRITVGVGSLRLPLSFAGGLHLLNGDQPMGSPEFSARGGLPALNRALQRLEYRAPADWSGTDQLDVWVSDLGEGGDGGAQEAMESFALKIEAVDDKPEISRPSAIHYLDEDTSLKIDFVAVSDADAGSVLTVLLQPDHGKVGFSPDVLEHEVLTNVIKSTNLESGEGQEHGQVELTIRGLVEDVDSAVKMLTYWPPADFAGQVEVLVRASDTGGLAVDDAIYLYVRPINDPPLISLPGVLEGEAKVQISAGGVGDAVTGLVISDIDVDDSSHLCTNMPWIEGRKALSLKMTPSAGFVSIRAKEAVGVRVVNTSTAGPMETLFVQGSVRSLRAALDGGHILYSAPTTFSGVDTILVEVDDGGNCGAGGVGSTQGTLEIEVPPYDPPLVVEFDVSSAEDQVLLTKENQSVVLPDLFVTGGSVGERSAVEVVLLAVSGNLTWTQDNMTNIELVDGSGSTGQRLHVRGLPSALTGALSGIVFEPRAYFFGFWNHNGSWFDDTPVRSPRIQGAQALAHVEVVATPDGQGTQVVFDGTRVRPQASWSIASVRISVGWVNDAPTLETPRLIVARGFEESVVPGIAVTDPDVMDASEGSGKLEVNVSSSAGGKLVVDEMVGLKNGLRNDGLSDRHMRLRGRPEYVNNVLATLTFQRNNTTEGERYASGDIIDEILVHVSDLGFSGAGGEQRAEASILVEAGVATIGTANYDTFELEKVLPLVTTREGSSVALPGLEAGFLVAGDAEMVTVALSAREGYLSLGPAGEGVALAAGNEDWGPAVTLIETTGGAEHTLPEVQVSALGFIAVPVQCVDFANVHIFFETRSMFLIVLWELGDTCSFL